MAGTAGEESSLPDLPSALSAMGAQRTTRESVARTGEGAAALQQRGWLDLDEGFVDGSFESAKKGGLAVWPTKRGKGTKIMAIAAVTSLPLAVNVDSASPHESQLLDETLAGSFLDELPARLIGDKAYVGHSLRVPHRKLPRHDLAWVHENHAEVFMRPVVGQVFRRSPGSIRIHCAGIASSDSSLAVKRAAPAGFR